MQGRAQHSTAQRTAPVLLWEALIARVLPQQRLRILVPQQRLGQPHLLLMLLGGDERLQAGVQRWWGGCLGAASATLRVQRILHKPLYKTHDLPS